MASMLDLAKVADLVLCLIDASFGFELETFEFINILQVHGFPRVMGVLTHLDGFSENKQLRKVKKTMKHRFWTEVYEGAKLFYLSGLQNGRYNRLETQNLARFIAVQKSSVLSWRQSHPYLLALRWEDQTPPTEPSEAARMLDLYGYVCGGRLREGSQAHLAGVGDFQIDELKKLPDPCPMPADIEAERLKNKPGADKDNKPKRKNALRTLAERHRAVYAPGSDVGSITVDSDAMYINLPEVQVGFTQRGQEENLDELPEAVRLVRELQSGGASALTEDGRRRRPLRLMQGGATVQLPANTLQAEDAGEGGASSSVSRPARRPAPGSAVTVERRASAASPHPGDDSASDDDGEEAESEGSGDEDDISEPEDTGDEAHRQEVLSRAKKRFERPPRLEEVIYGNASAGGSSAGSREDIIASSGSAVGATDHKTIPLFDDAAGDSDDGLAGTAANGDSVGSAKGKLYPQLLGNTGIIDGDDSVRMAVLPGASGDWDDERKEALKGRKFITGGWSSAEEDDDGSDGEGGKRKKGVNTEASEDESQAEDADEKEKAEEAKADKDGKDGAEDAAPGDIEGFSDSAPIATFVRVRLKGVPAACVSQMRRDKPLLLGGLLPGESSMGMVQMRVKRHRWHPKLLKTGDALLLSIGWRRYQTVPTFSLEDRGEKRMRMLKYTLEHAHCTMTCYGPLVPPNSGVVAFRSFKKVSHFRASATGSVLESAPDFEIKKKLKLVGEPYKIFKNTAFIKNMFTSDLEVSKYQHVKIQTVSGIRGEVKKPEGNRGCLRATFEDRILMSDLVICKCWINVEPKKFYHPVVDVAEWRPARLIGELRAAKGVPIPDNKDSHYGAQFVRPERKFNPLKVPKLLQQALPFSSKLKTQAKKSKNALRKKTAIVSSEREKEVNSLLIRLNTIRKEKHRIRQASNSKKKAAKEVREKFIQDKRDVVTKEARKKRYIKEGNTEQMRRKAMRLE
jgi:ribosome biogenesis protein BMS1